MDTPAGPGRNGDAPFNDRLAIRFYPLFQRVFDSNGDFVDSVNTKLGECRRDTPVEMYMSRCLGYGVITGGVLWFLTTLLVGGFFMIVNPDVGTILGIPAPSDRAQQIMRALKVPLLISLTGIVFGTIGFLSGLFLPIGNLWMTSGSREREINMLLPDAVSFMYALSVGGLNQLEILEAIAKAEDVYGEVAREFQIIMHETTYFDVDYRTAIRNRSSETPSDNLAQFLTDMLSILSSGGDLTSFLDLKKEKHMRTAKQQQENTLETLELFGEMYMTLSLFPLLLVILLVSMSLMGDMDDMMLYGAVYGMIPISGIVFILMISTVKNDDPGDGYLTGEVDDPRVYTESVSDRGVIKRYAGSKFAVLQEIRDREGTMKAKKYFRHPLSLFYEFPTYTLAITVPLAGILIWNLVSAGLVPTAWDSFKGNPVWGTFVYFHIPLYMIGLPFIIAYELKQRRRHVITNKISENLRKLSSANDTGLTLLESFLNVSDTSTGKLSEEFEAIYGKVQYGTSLKQALIELNNKYHLPRVARTIKLVADAQEASSQITDVLSTAAQASENQDDLERARKTGARMQMVIIMMTFLTMLAVMAILKLQFLDVMGELSESASGSGGKGGTASLGGVDVEQLNTVFFHAVTLQGVMAGLISGYMRDGKLLSGIKYCIVLVTIALVVWMFV